MAGTFHTVMTDYSTVDIALRLLASLLCGFIIGFEREYTNKWAGLRTHILVTIGSCVFTILSIYSFPKFVVDGSHVAVGDSARVAAQIITGIGFIGGGTVLRHGSSVFGLTTAASLWVSASVGMALGSGDFFIAFAASFLCIFVLVFIRKFQNVFIKPNRKQYSTIKAVIIVDEDHVSEITNRLYDEFEQVVEMKIKKSARDEEKSKITFKVDIFSKNPTKTAFETISKIDKIESVTLQQDFSD